jgi:type II secretory pathway component PulJ
MRNRLRIGWRTTRGFTFAEVMTSLTTLAVVGAAIVSVTVNTFSTVGYQTRMLDTQLDVASAMALLRNDLLAAGYVVDGMNEDVFQQVTTGTTSDNITLVGDVNSDGISERVTYAVADGQLQRTQDTWDGGGWTVGTALPVANNVTVFTLQFYRSCAFVSAPAPTPQPTPAPPTLQTAAEVTAGRTSLVKITLTATATYKGKTVSKTLTSEVAERQDNVRPQC